MNIKPIRDLSDYDATITRINAIFDAPLGTPEADELEILTALVERYQENHFSIGNPRPLEAIKFRMEQLGLSPRHLEPFIGSRSRVSEIMNGSRALTLDMIRALNVHLRIPAEVLIQEDSERSERSDAELPKAAIGILLANGVLNVGERIEHFLRRALGDRPVPAMLRKTRTERTNAKADALALHAWRAAVLIKAEKFEVPRPFKRASMPDNVARNLAKLSARSDGPQLVSDYLRNLGIVFLVFPHLPATHLDGAAMLRSDGTPIIALTLRIDRIDNFWFTLLHEFKHVSDHLVGNTEFIFDDLEISSTEHTEREADFAARTALIPDLYWESMRNGKYTSLSDIFDVAQRAGVHPAIAAGRWQKENRDYRRFSKLLGHGTIRPLLSE